MNLTDLVWLVDGCLIVDDSHPPTKITVPAERARSVVVSLSAATWSGELRVVMNIGDSICRAVVPVVHARLRELIAYHETRLSRFADVVETGARTAYDVANASTWTRHEKPLMELDPFNRTLAVNETLAHLEFLVVKSQLTVDVDDSGVASFRKN